MDDKNPVPTNDPAHSGDAPVITADKDQDKGLPKNPNDEKQKEAYRKEQSRADKAEAGKNDTDERLAFLEGIAGESMKKTMISDFVKEFGSKYPDVSVDDLNELATSPDELESKAKYLQKKVTDLKQSTLASVREVPADTMSAEEKAKALKELKPSSHSFADFLRIQSTKLRK